MIFAVLLLALTLCFPLALQAAPILLLEDRPLLTFKEVILHTLEFQWSVQSSELTVKTQEGLFEQATGAFNPQLTASASRLFQRDIQNPLGTKTDFNGRTTNTALSLQTLTRFGTTYSINFTNENVRNPTDIPNPTDATTVGFSINQPLLRNLLFSPQTTLEETQRMQLKAFRLQNVQNIASALFNSTVAYWGFVSAKKVLEIQIDLEQRFCEIARYADNLILEDQAGFTTAYQPHADLHQATANRIQAEQNLRAAYNTLLFNMGFIPDDNQAIPDFKFEDFPDFCSYAGLDQKWYDDLLTAIPLNRSDLIAAEIVVKIADYNLRSAKNSLLPTVDLIGSANFLNTEALKKAEDVFDSTKARNPEKDYTVGINFSFPIFNDTARGLVKQQRAQRSQAQVNLDLLGGQLVSNFKTAYTLSNALLEEVKKNALAADEYRKTVEAEKIKLENGLSTYFVVLTLENNWLTALLNWVASETQFVQNLLQLRLLSGTLVRWDRQGEIVTDVEDVFSYPVIGEAPSQPVENFFEEYCILPNEGEIHGH